MFNRVLVALSSLVVASNLAAQADSPRAILPEHHFEFLDNYCLGCHDADTEKGSVNLDDLSLDIGEKVASAELWQKVLTSINSGEMPPEDKKQPKPKEKADFLADLSNQLVVARDILADSGGVITLRRLNRREYENTIRDLLGVDIEAEELPDDENAGGFDTAGAALFFSSDQFEQYIKVARRALDEAMMPLSKPKIIKVRREAETDANRSTTRTAASHLKNHERAEAWRNSGGKPPTDFGFIDEARVAFEDGNYKRYWPAYDKYLKNPLNQKGATLTKYFFGAQVDTTLIPKKAAPGNYIIRVRAAALDTAKPHQRFLEYGLNRPDAQKGEIAVLGCREVTGTLAKPQILEIPFTVPRFGGRSFALRERQPNTREHARTLYLKTFKEGAIGIEPALWIDWVEYEGPFVDEWPPKQTQQLFFKGKAAKKNDAYAQEIIKRFAKRAFRIKEPTPTYLQKLVDLYRGRIRAGEKFEEALKEPLSIILASPNFLYFGEPTAEKKKRQLTDNELAIRLSYFLWSAPPDDELRSLAAKNQLREGTNLWKQTQRLLKHSNSAEFIAGFTHQWLHMDRLDFFQFNHQTYAEFDESTKEAAREEVYASLRRVLLNGDLKIGELLKTDKIVINDLLANFYAIPGVKGHEFRTVDVPADQPRGGVLGMAAILAMGSDGEKASVVERGAWVMRKLLHSPPPPAPPNVPQLSRLEEGEEHLTARVLIKAHQEEPQCAQCHRKIDPIGFGLQNFNAVGRWQETESTTAKIAIKSKKGGKKRVKTETKEHLIDASGKLPNGTPFSDFFGLRDGIAAQEEAFARGFTEALIEYGLGRPYGFSDSALAERMMKAAKDKDYRANVFIHRLVQSKPFQTK